MQAAGKAAGRDDVIDRDLIRELYEQQETIQQLTRDNEAMAERIDELEREVDRIRKDHKLRAVW